MAQLLVVLDVSVVNVALPSVQADLGLARVDASWVAMAYSLGFAGLLLVGARLADVVGAARLLAWSVGAFTFASLVAGLANEGWVLIAARAGQGISAAAASPATFTMLTATHPEGPERTRAVAIWTAVSLAGGGLGSVASGVFTDLMSWRATLLVNVPIGVGVVIAARTLYRLEGRPRGVAKIDIAGAALATLACTCAAYGMSIASEPGSGSVATAAGVVAIVALVVLALQQRRSRHSLVPRALARDRRIILGNIATALIASCFQVALWYYLTYRMQGQFGYTPTQTGLAFLPLTITMLMVNLWLTPRLMKRWDPSQLVTVGAGIAAPGLIWLSIAGDGPFSISLLAPTVLIGIGGGLLGTPLATVVTAGVRAEHAGAASGLMNTAKQFGGVLGLAAATTATGLAGTDGVAFVLMALAVAGAAVIALPAREGATP